MLETNVIVLRRFNKSVDFGVSADGERDMSSSLVKITSYNKLLVILSLLEKGILSIRREGFQQFYPIE